MNCYLQTFATVVVEASSDWVKHQAAQMGAALAFYGVLSLAPLLVIALAIGSLAFDKQTATDHMLAQLTDLMGPDAARAVRELLTFSPQPTAQTIATVLSFLVLLWGASGVFASLQVALNTIWEAPPQRVGYWAYLVSQLLALGMVLGIGGLLLFSLTLSTTISAVGHFMGGERRGLEPLLHLGDACATLLVVTLLFAMIFKLLPPVRVAWRDVALGASITAVLFTIGKLFIGLYLGKSGLSSAYGAAGSLVVLVVWIYYSAQILLFGAELTQAFSHRYGSRAASR